MIKTIFILSALCFIVLMQKVAAQAIDKADTAKTLSRNAPGRTQAKIARHDARRFRLPKDLLIRMRAGDITVNSDYFKPTRATTPDAALLADSGYVKTYVYYAFNVAHRQLIHPVGTGLLIGGSILTFMTALIWILETLAPAKN